MRPILCSLGDPEPQQRPSRGSERLRWESTGGITSSSKSVEGAAHELAARGIPGLDDGPAVADVFEYTLARVEPELGLALPMRPGRDNENSGPRAVAESES